MDRERPPAVRLEPWEPGDLPLLQQLLGNPAMTEHIGGPESPQQIAERHERYLRFDPSKGRLFKIVTERDREAVGWVGYWERRWREEDVFEIGWSVLPAFQGRGIASMGTAHALARARADGTHRFVHAFPSVDNVPSNAICRRVGFTFVEKCEFEYPPGHFMQCNDWKFDLRASG